MVFVICFTTQWMIRSKHGLFIFPPKNPNMEKVLFDCPIVMRYDVNEKYPLISRKFSGIHSRVIRKSLYRSLAVENEDPQWVFQDTGFALFEVCYPGF